MGKQRELSTRLDFYTAPLYNGSYTAYEVVAIHRKASSRDCHGRSRRSAQHKYVCRQCAARPDCGGEAVTAAQVESVQREIILSYAEIILSYALRWLRLGQGRHNQ